MIKLLLLDIDGILTDGKKTYDKSGNVLSKTFCDKDWTALKRFRSMGIPTVFVSGDPWNKQIAANRNIEFYDARGKNKGEIVESIAKKRGINQEDIWFGGDDLFDIPAMEACGNAFCPKDAPDAVKAVCQVVIPRKGGENLICFLFDYMQDKNIIPTVPATFIMDKIEAYDALERF